MRVLLILCVSLLVFDHAVAADKELRVAVAQPLVIPGDVEGNIERMKPMIAEAAKRKAQLVVFSECAVTGYDLKGVGVQHALTMQAKELEQLGKLARKHKVTLIAGFHEKDGEQYFNTAGVFFPDGRTIFQRKHKVMESESRFCPVQAGERNRICFEVEGFKCAILICADTGIPGIFDELAGNGCDAVISITAGAGDEKLGFHLDELKQPDRLKKYLETALPCIGSEMIRTTLRLKLAQIACNQCGWLPEKNYYHPGGSIVVDGNAETVAVIPPRFVFEHIKLDLAVGTIHKTR